MLDQGDHAAGHEPGGPDGRAAAGDFGDLHQPAAVDHLNPPAGAQFYPFFSTTFRHGVCTWQQGGRFIPGTVNDFGGSSTAEFGPLLRTLYPVAGFTTTVLINNFNSGDMRNPCRA